MIEPFDEWIDGSFQVGEVEDPAETGVDGTADGHFAAKRVAVDAAALVPFGHVRQKVRCFETEVFYELDNIRHGAEFIPRIRNRPTPREAESPC